MNIMDGIITILTIPMLTMVGTDTHDGGSVWDMDMADGDLESPMATPCIPLTDTATVVTATMTHGVHGATEDTTEADTGVDITMVIIMDTGTDTMTEEVDIITQPHMLMVKWIAAAHTDTPGHPVIHMVLPAVTQ